MSFASARKKAGLTQREAARELGVSCAAVAWWELGKTMPKASSLLGIANLYKCTVEDLLTEDDFDQKPAGDTDERKGA